MTIEDFVEEGPLIKDEALRRIFENKNPYMVKIDSSYDVHANNLHFICTYSDEEIEMIADLCLELLEELRRINEAGYTKEDMLAAKTINRKGFEDFFDCYRIYETFRTERIENIIDRLGETTRVGDAYYLMVSKPTFISGICAVFDVIIGRFEDAELYFSALFMLIRVAMHMHCDELK